MKVLVALDSFKGCLSSLEAGKAVKQGILKAHPEAEVIVLPLADGGEGTAKTLAQGLGGDIITCNVHSPLGKLTKARYTLKGTTAIMEMAEASGLSLINKEELNPYLTNTVGVGEMIRDALSRGVRHFIIGLGGSATTEAGIGMLSSLGVKFLDKDKRPLSPTFSSLSKIESISLENLPSELSNCSFEIASDVNNPLTGLDGSIAVFGRQKGVIPEEIQKMDQDLNHFSKVAARTFGIDKSQDKGAGAAGGLGFAFLSFFENVTLRPGFEIIADILNLKEALKNVDFVVTGEGRCDSQTAMGKGPVGLAKLAKEVGVSQVIALAGSVGATEVLNNEGIDAIFPIQSGPITLEEAMKQDTALKNLERTAEQVFRLLK